MVHCEAPTSSNNCRCAGGNSAQAIFTISAVRLRVSPLGCSLLLATLPNPTLEAKWDSLSGAGRVISGERLANPQIHSPPFPADRRSGRHERVDAGHRAADDQLLDLRGALVQGGDAHVAEVALDRVVVHVARAAVNLDC